MKNNNNIKQEKCDKIQMFELKKRKQNKRKGGVSTTANCHLMVAQI